MKSSSFKRNAQVALLSLMVGMLYFIPYIRYVFYDQTLETLQLTNTQLGNLASAYGVTAVFGYCVSGVLAQRFNPKILITISLIGTGAATVWQATIPSFTSLLIIFVLYAIFTTVTLWSPYILMMRNFGTEAEQGRLFGVSEAVRSIAAAGSGFLFIWIFAQFANGNSGYRAMLLVASVIYFVFAIMAMIFLPNIKKQEKKGGKGEGSTMQALKLPGVWLVGMFIFFVYAFIISGSNYFGTYSTQVLNASDSLASTLQTIRTYGLTIVLGVVGGIVIDKAKYRSRFMIGILAVGLVLTISVPFLVSYFWVSVVVTVAISGLAYVLKSVYYSIMGEALIPLELTGIASGIISFIAYIPDAFLPTMVGAWLDEDLMGGFDKLFMLMAFCVTMAIVIALIINRRYINSQKLNTPVE